MKILSLILFFFCASFLFGKNSPDSNTVSCIRNIFVSDNKITCTLLISKPEKGGFARIYEKLPEGAVINNIKCGKGVYKTEKNMLRIVWDDIPTQKTIEVSYQLILKNSVTDTLHAVTGTFSAEFLPPDKENIPVIAGTIQYEKKKTEIALVNTETKNESVNLSSKEKQTANPDGIYFCIQVAAVGKNVPSDYLKKTFGYDGEFESHFEENIYRITIGKYKSFKEAEASMAEMKEKYFKKCFLSAYKDGHKIPLYEAQRLLQ